LRDDLKQLTLLPFEGLLCSLFLFRRFRSWCPTCLKEWQTSGGELYEPLLWSLRVASVCPDHHLPFQSVCPHCERPMAPIMSFSRPGHCGRCGGWLGVMPAKRVPKELSTTTSEYWVSNAAGDLLALASHVGSRPSALRSVFRDNLDSCVRHLFRGNGAEFAKFVGSTATSAYNWRNGAAMPRIDQLLRISDRLRVPIEAFLTAGRAADWKVIKPSAANYALPIALHRSSAKVRQALRLALSEHPAPSLREVARRLGYRGTDGLRRVGRSLCKRITDNYQKSVGPEPYYNGPRPRICQPKEIEAALKAALAQDNPESVPQVARRLGYVTSGPFFKPFPALCRAIHLKIARRKAARIRQMRRIAEAALQENPPPSLRALAVRLGYKDKKVFARHFPDLGSKLQARRKALARKHAAQLREELQRYTRTEPAPSMAEVCRRLGLKHLTASRKFPKEYKLIVSRYQRRCRAVARLRRHGSRLRPS